MTEESRDALAGRRLTTEQAAQYLALSPNTLMRWRWTGDGPRYLKLGRAVRYDRADLDAYVAQSGRNSTSAA